MLWIIGEKAQMPVETRADIERLGGNGVVSGDLGRTVYNSTRTEVQTLLSPGVGGGEPIFVLSHAGFDDRDDLKDQPWIGGLWFDEFVSGMVAKFTVTGLSGRILWFMVCHVGHDIRDLATRLSGAGVRDTTIYLPKEFMYVSTKGIPHVLENQKDVDAANKLVRKWGCEFMRITESKETGVGWAGARIDANGTVTVLGLSAVTDAVLGRFDPNGEGDIS